MDYEALDPTEDVTSTDTHDPAWSEVGSETVAHEPIVEVVDPEPATSWAADDADRLVEGIGADPSPADGHDGGTSSADPHGSNAEIGSAPQLYEYGTLVSQEPIADDLVRVSEIVESPAYRAWVAGGLSVAPVDGAIGVSEAWTRPGMVGDSGDVNFWFEQNSRFSCGPSTAAQIISDFTGVIHSDERALELRALEMGWYDPDAGMHPENLARLLNDQGVSSRVHRDQTFADIEQYLREGRAVIMFVDSGNVRPAEFALPWDGIVENSPEDKVDHFVRIIGIDRQAGVAILSDPGYAGGRQFEIPLDQLEEAWNDNTLVSNTEVDRAKMLIVSDGSDPTPDDLVELPPVGPGTAERPPVGQTDAPVPAPEPAGPRPPGPDATRPDAGPLPPAPGPAPGPPPTPGPEAPAPPAAPERPPTGTGPVRLPGSLSVPGQPVELGAGLELGSESHEGEGEDDEDGADEPSAGVPLGQVPGWVLVPVTLAAGRVGAAIAQRRATT